MADAECPWYATVDGAGLQPREHLYRESEITSGLHMYCYLRRELPPDYRIELRRVAEGLGKDGQPYQGQIWKGDRQLLEEAGRSLPVLLMQLRASSATLDPPLEW